MIIDVERELHVLCVVLASGAIVLTPLVIIFGLMYWRCFHLVAKRHAELLIGRCQRKARRAR